MSSRAVLPNHRFHLSGEMVPFDEVKEDCLHNDLFSYHHMCAHVGPVTSIPWPQSQSVFLNAVESCPSDNMAYFLRNFGILVKLDHPNVFSPAGWCRMAIDGYPSDVYFSEIGYVCLDSYLKLNRDLSYRERIEIVSLLITAASLSNDNIRPMGLCSVFSTVSHCALFLRNNVTEILVHSRGCKTRDLGKVSCGFDCPCTM